MRPSKDEWAIELSRITAKRSTCCRRQVGCTLLNGRGHVIGTGYNGVAAGLNHCNELEVEPVIEDHSIFVIDKYPNACPGAKSKSGENLDGCYAIHAEQNALLQCKNVYEIEKCFVTTSPCITCVKLLMNTSCKEIIFIEAYRGHELSEKLWVDSGRTWVQYVPKEEK